MLFAGLLLFITVFFLFLGICFLRMNEKNLNFWEKLPRNRTAGGITGLIALLAFIPNVKPLFSPENNLYWLVPTAFVLAFLCWRYLDHLFARAAAGAVILLAHRMLAESFNADLTGSSFFAIMCFAAGTYAICTAAKPYWLRDSFRAMCRNKKWKWTGAAAAFLWSLSALILLIQQAGRVIQ